MIILLVAPSAAAPSPGEIVVTTSSDAVNGDVSSVAALAASPGPDGISLREAIHATNNDPGTYTVRFATAMTVVVESVMPPLRGGRVAIERPATIRASPQQARVIGSTGFQLSSSGNRLHGLTIEDFYTGVDIRPFNSPVPIGRRPRSTG